MSEQKISFNTFPNNKQSALTMLYLQNQDLSDLSPEELLDKYDEVYDKIKKYSKSKLQQSRSSIQ